MRRAAPVLLFCVAFLGAWLAAWGAYDLAFGHPAHFVPRAACCAVWAALALLLPALVWDAAEEGR